MTSSHQFGGKWTDIKLTYLRKYLLPYLVIFKRNPKAAWFKTIYVDAFAGTGSRSVSVPPEDATVLPNEEDLKMFRDGSARIALEAEHSFDRYLFIEQNPEYVQQLAQLRREFPQKASNVDIRQGDANDLLQEWCQHTDWRTHRSIVFLDPYGMEVDWNTMQTIAHTQAIDLWILFPLGQAVNRLLTKKGPPPEAWAHRLTRFFGTDAWRDAFYQTAAQMDMFSTAERLEKTANFDTIGGFFVQRLQSIFAGVAQNPLALHNSKHVPLYLLCFAAGNPKGAPTAIKIAQDILRKQERP